MPAAMNDLRDRTMRIDALEPVLAAKGYKLHWNYKRGTFLIELANPARPVNLDFAVQSYIVGTCDLEELTEML